MAESSTRSRRSRSADRAPAANADTQRPEEENAPESAKHTSPKPPPPLASTATPRNYGQRYLSSRRTRLVTSAALDAEEITPESLLEGSSDSDVLVPIKRDVFEEFTAPGAEDRVLYRKLYNAGRRVPRVELLRIQAGQPGIPDDAGVTEPKDYLP